jgi:hypothetical protein
MNFEHLIQINDPDNPLVESLTRDQLWQGLLYRVEDPVPFLPGLESCTILERQANELLRELDFGPATIRDRVTLLAAEWVRFDIVPSETHAGGRLTISGGTGLHRIRQIGLSPVRCRLRPPDPHARRRRQDPVSLPTGIQKLSSSSSGR